MWKKGSHLRVRGKGLCLTHFKNHGSMEPLIILYVTFSLSRCIPSAATSQLKALVLLPSSIIILCGDLPALSSIQNYFTFQLEGKKLSRTIFPFPLRKVIRVRLARHHTALGTLQGTTTLPKPNGDYN